MDLWEVQVTVIAEAKCTMDKCGRIDRTNVEEEKLRRWINGELIQNVWPEMSAIDREIVMQSQFAYSARRIVAEPMYICPKCWAVMDKALGIDDE